MSPLQLLSQAIQDTTPDKAIWLRCKQMLFKPGSYKVTREVLPKIGEAVNRALLHLCTQENVLSSVQVSAYYDDHIPSESFMNLAEKKIITISVDDSFRTEKGKMEGTLYLIAFKTGGIFLLTFNPNSQEFLVTDKSIRTPAAPPPYSNIIRPTPLPTIKVVESRSTLYYVHPVSLAINIRRTAHEPLIRDELLHRIAEDPSPLATDPVYAFTTPMLKLQSFSCDARECAALRFCTDLALATLLKEKDCATVRIANSMNPERISLKTVQALGASVIQKSGPPRTCYLFTDDKDKHPFLLSIPEAGMVQLFWLSHVLPYEEDDCQNALRLFSRFTEV